MQPDRFAVLCGKTGVSLSAGAAAVAVASGAEGCASFGAAAAAVTAVVCAPVGFSVVFPFVVPAGLAVVVGATPFLSFIWIVTAFSMAYLPPLCALYRSRHVW